MHGLELQMMFLNPSQPLPHVTCPAPHSPSRGFNGFSPSEETWAPAGFLSPTPCQAPHFTSCSCSLVPVRT